MRSSTTFGPVSSSRSLFYVPRTKHTQWSCFYFFFVLSLGCCPVPSSSCFGHTLTAIRLFSSHLSDPPHHPPSLSSVFCVRRGCRSDGPRQLLFWVGMERYTQVEVLEYPELGMEAVWKIDVENFPAFIVVDGKGDCFTQTWGRCMGCQPREITLSTAASRRPAPCSRTRERTLWVCPPSLLLRQHVARAYDARTLAR